MTTASYGTPLTVLYYDGQSDPVVTTGGGVINSGGTTFPATLSSTGVSAGIRLDFYDFGSQIGESQYLGGQLFDTKAHASAWISAQATSLPNEIAVAAYPT
jgi:hypothetical protein